MDVTLKTGVNFRGKTSRRRANAVILRIVKTPSSEVRIPELNKSRLNKCVVIVINEINIVLNESPFIVFVDLCPFAIQLGLNIERFVTHFGKYLRHQCSVS